MSKKTKMYVVTDSSNEVIGVIHGSIPEKDLAPHIAQCLIHEIDANNTPLHNYTDSCGVMRWSYTAESDTTYHVYVQAQEVTGAPAVTFTPRNTDSMSEAWSLVEKYYPNYSQCDTIAMSDDLSNIEAGQIGDSESAAYKLLHNVYAGNVERACSDLIVVEREIYERTLLAIKEYLASKIGEEETASSLTSEINDMKEYMENDEDLPPVEWADDANGYHVQVNESSEKTFPNYREMCRYLEGMRDGMEYAGLG